MLKKVMTKLFDPTSELDLHQYLKSVFLIHTNHSTKM